MDSEVSDSSVPNNRALPELTASDEIEVYQRIGIEEQVKVCATPVAVGLDFRIRQGMLGHRSTTSPA